VKNTGDEVVFFQQEVIADWQTERDYRCRSRYMQSFRLEQGSETCLVCG